MDYSKFKDSYDENLIAKWKNHEVELDVETLRSLLYGYTFKPEYTNGVIEDALSMDFIGKKEHLKMMMMTAPLLLI